MKKSTKAKALSALTAASIALTMGGCAKEEKHEVQVSNETSKEYIMKKQDDYVDGKDYHYSFVDDNNNGISIDELEINSNKSGSDVVAKSDRKNIDGWEVIALYDDDLGKYYFDVEEVQNEINAKILEMVSKLNNTPEKTAEPVKTTEPVITTTPVKTTEPVKTATPVYTTVPVYPQYVYPQYNWQPVPTRRPNYNWQPIPTANVWPTPTQTPYNNNQRLYVFLKKPEVKGNLYVIFYWKDLNGDRKLDYNEVCVRKNDINDSNANYNINDGQWLYATTTNKDYYLNQGANSRWDYYSEAQPGQMYPTIDIAEEYIKQLEKTLY